MERSSENSAEFHSGEIIIISGEIIIQPFVPIVAGLPADVSRLLHHHPGRAHGAGRRVVPRTWGRRGVARSYRY